MKQETDFVKQEPASSPAAMIVAEAGQAHHDTGPDDDEGGILGDGANAPSPVVAQHDIYDDYEVEDDGFEEVVAAYISAGDDVEMESGRPAVVAGVANDERLEIRGGAPEPPALGIHQPFAAHEQDVARIASVPKQPVEPVPEWIDLGGKIKIWDLELTIKDKFTLARPIAFVQFGTVPVPGYKRYCPDDDRLTSLQIFDRDGSFLYEPFFPLDIVGIGLAPGQIIFKAPIQPSGVVSFRARDTPETSILIRWLPRVTMVFPELGKIASGPQ